MFLWYLWSFRCPLTVLKDLTYSHVKHISIPLFIHLQFPNEAFLMMCPFNICSTCNWFTPYTYSPPTTCNIIECHWINSSSTKMLISTLATSEPLDTGLISPLFIRNRANYMSHYLQWSTFKCICFITGVYFKTRISQLNKEYFGIVY